jgi:hypothetical protein
MRVRMDDGHGTLDARAGMLDLVCTRRRRGEGREVLRIDAFSLCSSSCVLLHTLNIILRCAIP